MKEKARQASESPEPKSKKKIIIIVIASAVLVLILALFITLYLTGPKRAVNRYAKASFSKKGGKAYLSLVLTDNIENQLKEDEKWDDMIEDYNDFVKDNLDGYKYKVKKITKGKKLSSSALVGAEHYFRYLTERYHSEYDYLDVKKGYEYTIKIVCKDKKEKSEEEKELKVCLVKIKKQGWKVIERSADKLESASSGNDGDINSIYDMFHF